MSSILDEEAPKTELVSLREILSGEHYYRIPDYQRGYAWDTEFIDLWKDIKCLSKKIDSNSSHYTGMLSLEKMSSKEREHERIKGKHSFYIVDGQQRITSLIIIVKAMIDNVKSFDSNFNYDYYIELLRGSERCKKFGYSLSRKDDSDEYFENRIFENLKTKNCNDLYLANINKAREYIDNELKKTDLDEVKRLIGLILDRMVFNIYFITEDFDVRVTFETMNNRGKRLSQLELLKNRLLYLSSFLKRDITAEFFEEDLKETINMSWKTVYDNLSFANIQLSDDEYLHAHWIVYHSLTKKNGSVHIDEIMNDTFSMERDSKFFKYLDKKDYDNAYNLIRDYVKSLADMSAYWGTVNCPLESKLNINEEEINWLDRLKRIYGNTLYSNAANMVVLYQQASLKLEQRINYYKKLEKFIFINKVIGQDKNDLSFLISGARNLLSSKIEEKVKKYNQLINQIDGHDISPKKTGRVEEVIKSFEIYLNKKNNLYYDWKGIRYFLYEYDRTLEIKASHAAKIIWSSIEKGSIEHIFPQTPKTEYWNVAFEKYMNDEDSKHKITNSLGNLLLLSTGAENSSLQNYSYPVKCTIDVSSNKFAYKFGSRSAQEVAENANWTPKQIYDRTNNLLQFMYNNWFSDIIIPADWKILMEKYDLIRFPYEEPEAIEQAELEKKLNSIDTSDERNDFSVNVNHTVEGDDWFDDIKQYFNPEVCPLRSNSKFFTPKKDIFTLKMDKDKKLEAKVKLSDCKYWIGVDYSDFSVRVWDDNNKKYITDLSALEPINNYISGLKRYFKYKYPVNDLNIK